LKAEQKITTDVKNFISIDWKFFIRNERKEKDFAGLYEDYWEGM